MSHLPIRIAATDAFPCWLYLHLINKHFVSATKSTSFSLCWRNTSRLQAKRSFQKENHSHRGDLALDMQQVTLHFLLLAAAGVLVSRVSSGDAREAVHAYKKLIEEEQMTSDKTTQVQNQLTTFLRNGISEGVQKVTESSEKLKELVSDLQKNLNSQIPPCAPSENKALQNIVDEFSNFSFLLANSESLVTGNSHASLPMFLLMKSFASLSSVVNGVITYQTQSLHKYCQTQSEESDIQTTIQKRYSELEKIYDNVAQNVGKNILGLLSTREELLKSTKLRTSEIDLKATDIGGHALRGSKQSVMTRFTREYNNTKASLLRKLHELCRGLDLERCQNNLDDHYPLVNGAILEKSLFPSFNIEKSRFKIMQAEDCIDCFVEYRRCLVVKNMMSTKLCPFPLCTL